MNHTLSKSDFKVAQTCPTKLYYKELGYPSTSDLNPYLRQLAMGGYMVEKMAKLLYPDGRTVPYDGGSEESDRLAREALALDQVTLFEATLLSRGMLARVDILVKTGNTFELIEVKSKSFSSADVTQRALKGEQSIFRTKKGAIVSDWRPYLEDVTFQVLVLRELFPSATIKPYLALVDKARTSTAETLHQLFQIAETRSSNGGRDTIEVTYTGDVEQLRNDHLTGVLDVAAEVGDLLPEMAAAAERYVASVSPTLAKIAVPLSVNCKSCEYRANDGDGRDGFMECWGDRGRAKPHLFDLCFLSTVGPISELTDQLIAKGTCSMYDIPVDRLIKRDGAAGSRNRRQVIQIEHTRKGSTWLSDGLRSLLDKHPYPLRFIDFETSTLALPYHAGMHPYEVVAFQWSCHTIPEPGAKPIHADWINSVDFFPNLEFAETLRQHVGTGGTVFMWATHEQTVLRAIAALASKRGMLGQELGDWILDMAGAKDQVRGRFVDMNKLTLDGYFHPVMGGRTSIKYVLAAAWSSDAELRAAHPEYVRYDGDLLLDPYHALPPLRVHGTDVVVTEGTGAMLAYQEMLYGSSRGDPDARTQYREVLRQYCALDTAAMVMIWEHWRRLAAGPA